MKRPYLTLAQYNRWMNQRLYAACGQLPQDRLEQDLGAFFGSVWRTLHHILIVDSFWLYRLSEDRSLVAMKDRAGLPIRISSNDQILFGDLAELTDARVTLDDNIVRFVEQCAESRLQESVTYSDTAGNVEVTRTVQTALLHWFNHQTHHRGQVTTLLTQQGVSVGETDLFFAELS